MSNKIVATQREYYEAVERLAAAHNPEGQDSVLRILRTLIGDLNVAGALPDWQRDVLWQRITNLEEELEEGPE